MKTEDYLSKWAGYPYQPGLHQYSREQVLEIIEVVRKEERLWSKIKRLVNDFFILKIW